MVLTESDIDSLNTDGYLGPIKAWDEEIAAGFRKRLDNVTTHPSPTSI